MRSDRVIVVLLLSIFILSSCRDNNGGIVLSKTSDSILHDTTPFNIIYDSLRTAFLKSKSDTVQLKILNELAIQNKKTALPLINDAIYYCIRRGNEPALAEALAQKGNSFTRLYEFDSAKIYLDKSKAIAVKLGSGKLSAYIDFYTGELFYQQDENAKAIASYENALKVAQGLQDRKLTAYALSGIAESYRMIDENEKSISFFERAMKITEKTGDQARTAFCLSSLGEIYRYQGDNQKALEYYSDALKMAQSIKDKGLITFCLSTIASVYVTTSEYDKALANYEEAIRIAKEYNNRNRISYCLSSIGEMYRMQNNFAKSLDYFNQTLAISEEMGDRARMAFCYSSIGEIYRVTGNFDKALEFLNRALNIAKETDDKSRIGFCYNTIGETYLVMGDTAGMKGNKELQEENYHKGILELDSAIAIATQIDDKIRIADCLSTKGEIHSKNAHSKSDPEFKASLEAFQGSLKLGEVAENYTRTSLSLGYIGRLYLKVGDPQTAIRYAERGLVDARKSEAASNVMTAADVLHRSYANTGNYKKAYEMHLLYKAMSDSLTNVDNVRRFAATEYKAKEEKLKGEKTKQEAEFKAEQIKKDAELQRQRTVRNAFIAGFALLLILAFVIYRSLQQNRKAKKIIEQQKKETELQKNVAEEKNREIIDSITYARRIQRSLLPTERYIADTLRRLQKPK